ncbi:DUF202 domain-containing protein [Nocardiopsis sp. LOL_012]|uniref:DUF202 domain-containing protein n=1 Tax=Nocardiopsis sp. LOL_012 TaxID=3345409 RepID=UPI003A8B79B3
MGSEESGKGGPVDYRFTLANERTFLAWLRTALALLAGAVAVLHLLPLDWAGVQRTTVGLVLALLAAVIAVYAPLRWYRVQRIMSRGGTLRMGLLPAVAAFAVFAVCVIILWGNLR